MQHPPCAAPTLHSTHQTLCCAAAPRPGGWPAPLSSPLNTASPQLAQPNHSPLCRRLLRCRCPVVRRRLLHRCRRRCTLHRRASPGRRRRCRRCRRRRLPPPPRSQTGQTRLPGCQRQKRRGGCGRAGATFAGFRRSSLGSGQGGRRPFRKRLPGTEASTARGARTARRAPQLLLTHPPTHTASHAHKSLFTRRAPLLPCPCPALLRSSRASLYSSSSSWTAHPRRPHPMHRGEPSCRRCTEGNLPVGPHPPRLLCMRRGRGGRTHGGASAQRCSHADMT